PYSRSRNLVIRLRTFVPMLAVVLLTACSLVPAELQRELLPSNTSYKTAEAAYQVLIERHVDKPASNVLLAGALNGATTEVQKEVPNATFPDGPLALTGSTWSDFAKFSDRLDTVLKAVPSADRTLVERAAVEGTAVTIGVLRGSQSLSLTLARARFSVPLETDSIVDGTSIGRIEVPQLVGAVADEVSNAVRRLNATGANALILDLRSDPGGDLSAAVDIASIFVRQGTLVYQTGRDGSRTPLDVNRRYYINSPKPLVVLVNKNS